MSDASPRGAAPRATFRSFERLRRPSEFIRARREGRKRAGRCLVMWAYRRNESPPRAARLGITVRRKDGGAVQRNLFKRRVREAFRLNKGLLPRGWDVVVAPKSGPPERFPPGHRDVAREFVELARALAGAPGGNA